MNKAMGPILGGLPASETGVPPDRVGTFLPLVFLHEPHRKWAVNEAKEAHR